MSPENTHKLMGFIEVLLLGVMLVSASLDCMLPIGCIELINPIHPEAPV